MARTARPALPKQRNPLLKDEPSQEELSNRLMMREVALKTSNGAKILHRLLWLKLNELETTPENVTPMLFKKLPDDEDGDDETVLYGAKSFFDTAFPWATTDDLISELEYVERIHGGEEIDGMDGLWIDADSAEILANEYGISWYVQALRDGPDIFTTSHFSFRARSGSAAPAPAPASPPSLEQEDDQDDGDSIPPTSSPLELSVIGMPLPTLTPARKRQVIEMEEEITADDAMGESEASTHKESSKTIDENEGPSSKRRRLEEVELELQNSRRTVRLLSLLVLGLGASVLISHTT